MCKLRQVLLFIFAQKSRGTTGHIADTVSPMFTVVALGPVTC